MCQQTRPHAGRKHDLARNAHRQVVCAKHTLAVLPINTDQYQELFALAVAVGARYKPSKYGTVCRHGEAPPCMTLSRFHVANAVAATWCTNVGLAR